MDEVDCMFDMGFSDVIDEVICFVLVDWQMLLFFVIWLVVIVVISGWVQCNLQIIEIDIVDVFLVIEQQFFEVFCYGKIVLLQCLFSQYQFVFCVVFCNIKCDCQVVCDVFNVVGQSVLLLYGDFEQCDCDQMLVCFVNGSVWVLVVIDVVVCGLDIKFLVLVVNFELVWDLEVYVYCIGCIVCVGE